MATKKIKPKKAPPGENAPQIGSLRIVRVRIDSLKPDDRNARLHDTRNLEAIKASLREFGQVEPLVVQRATRRVVGGNGRMSAMVELGMTECDIVEVELDEKRARALAIALNRTGELASWDPKELERQIGELSIDLPDFDFGFADGQLDSLLEGDFEAAHGFTPAKPKKKDPPKKADVTHLWMLVIKCESEQQQAELIEEMEKRGIECTAPSA